MVEVDLSSGKVTSRIGRIPRQHRKRTLPDSPSCLALIKALSAGWPALAANREYRRQSATVCPVHTARVSTARAAGQMARVRAFLDCSGNLNSGALGLPRTFGKQDRAHDRAAQIRTKHPFRGRASTRPRALPPVRGSGFRFARQEWCAPPVFDERSQTILPAEGLRLFGFAEKRWNPVRNAPKSLTPSRSRLRIAPVGTASVQCD